MSDLFGAWVKKLCSQPVNFLANKVAGSPVVMSTRIRLARNLANLAFPAAESAESAAEVASLVKMALQNTGALGKNMLTLANSELNDLERAILRERHLTSIKFIQKDHSVLHASGNGQLSIMVNEEDHLHLQAILPGLQFNKAWQQVSGLDDALSRELDIAFDGTLGYLTAAPGNVGTGMRISVMLHLPALTLEDNIKPLERGLAKLGLNVRGMFGEDSEAAGNFYQISNQSTLGESEAEIIDHFKRVIEQIIEHEEAARMKLLDCQRTRLLDKVGRAFGTLRYSYILSAKEAFKALSGVRLGVDLKLFNSLDLKTVNELFAAVGKGCLQYHAGSRLAEAELDAMRSQVVREKLKHGNAA